MTSNPAGEAANWLLRDVKRSALLGESIVKAGIIDPSVASNIGIGKSLSQQLTRNAVHVNGLADVGRNFERMNAKTFGQIELLRNTLATSGVLEKYSRDAARLATSISSQARRSFPLKSAVTYSFEPPTVPVLRTVSQVQTMLKSPGMLAIAEMTRRQSEQIADLARVNSWAWDRPAGFVADAMLARSATRLDALGPLWNSIAAHPNARTALDGAVGSFHSPGALGIDFATIEDRAERFAFEVSELDRDARAEIDAAVGAASEATHTSSPAVRHQVEALGLGDFAKHYSREVSIIVSFSVGLTITVLQTGWTGNFEPMTVVEAFGAGAGVYKLARRRLQ